MSIIKVENLSKKYLISHESQERYTAMRDVVANKVKKIFSFPKSLHAPKSNKEEFYALKDVNFEIEQGDRVGIIGRNGAGKSTLLKVLSRITEPSTGRITINGRVASLLEVGTGFHPELSGRENIYLNGAILGMSRAEIKCKFDEIVDFAEVEKFLDTPVKRYSSGMYVRLAFAVAAHLEPEILIVDEVLAVGDAQFQKKCLGKMEDVSKNGGRTVLFVSHNMGAINSLCLKGLLLDKNRLIEFDNISKITQSYFEILQSKVFVNNDEIQIEVNPLDKTYLWRNGSLLEIKINWKNLLFPEGCICDVAFYTLEGIKLFVLKSDLLSNNSLIPINVNAITFTVENIGFAEQELRIDIGIKENNTKPYKILVENAHVISIPPDDKNQHKSFGGLLIPPSNINLW